MGLSNRYSSFLFGSRKHRARELRNLTPRVGRRVGPRECPRTLTSLFQPFRAFHERPHETYHEGVHGSAHESVHESGQFSHVLFSHVLFIAHQWLLMSMESQTRSSKQAFRESQSSRVQGNLPTLCQPIDNPSPTFR